MGEGIIQDVERYGVIMFVSFSVGNTGPFKEITGITTLAENLKKEFLEENKRFTCKRRRKRNIKRNRFKYKKRRNSCNNGTKWFWKNKLFGSTYENAEDDNNVYCVGS